MNFTSRRMVYTFAIGGVLATAGVSMVTQLLAPPTTPPAYTEARPVPADNRVIAHTEEIVIDVPLNQYNEWSANTPLESILPGSDSVPSVTRTDMIQGEWGTVGARRVVLSDGHFAAEEILATDAKLFRYQVWGYTNFARFATDYAIGEFRMEAVRDRTYVKWTYSFHRQSPVTYIFLGVFVNSIWADYMHSVLQLMKEKSEEAAAL